MRTKESMLKEIEMLKAKKPNDWQRHVKKLAGLLWYLENRYFEHEDHGNEERGRKRHPTDGCPIYDRMGENSYP